MQFYVTKTWENDFSKKGLNQSYLLGNMKTPTVQMYSFRRIITEQSI